MTVVFVISSSGFFVVNQLKILKYTRNGTTISRFKIVPTVIALKTFLLF